MQPLTIKKEWAERKLPQSVLADLQPLINKLQTGKLVDAAHLPARYSVIFSGPAGSGKKMAAAQVSGSTGQPVYLVNLSQLVSKYTGETEKNLKQVFEAATRLKAILFFDEADALFGKRTEVRDAHDRYANVEANYLLQMIENYDGIVVIASTTKDTLDSPFIRRINQVIKFPPYTAP